MFEIECTFYDLITNGIDNKLKSSATSKRIA